MAAHGICRFCGQMIEIGDELSSPEKNNEAATLMCDCPDSRPARQRAKQILQAKEAIDGLFDATGDGASLNPVEEDSVEHAVKILKSAVGPIVDRNLYKISIDIPGGVRVVVARSGKDKVAVERGDAIKRKTEI